MADKKKTVTAPLKNVKSRYSAFGVVPNTAKNISRPKVNKNTTCIGSDAPIRQRLPYFDGEYKRIAYGKFLRAMLEECLVDEKIERNETDMEIQMGQLADRLQKTMDQLDRTNRRLKDISFVVEHKRLLDLKTQHCSKFYEMTDKSNIQDMMKELTATEQAYFNQLDTKGVDFGYDKDSGHKQLLDAVTEAVDGLEEIKKISSLDSKKFEEYQRSGMKLKDMEKEKFDFETMKSEFEAKFPKFNEKLLKEASEKIAMLMVKEK